MIKPEVPPDTVPPQFQGDNQDQQSSQDIRTHDISDIRWTRIILTIAFIILIGIIGWIVITEGGTFISGLISHITGLFDRSTIDPHNKKGFTNFVQILLTAGFIGLALYFFRRR